MPPRKFPCAAAKKRDQRLLAWSASGTKASRGGRAWNRSDMGVLGPQLNGLGLVVRESRGDGNCLFRAVSDALCGDEAMLHAALRERCCEQMRAEPDFYRLFLLEEEEGAYGASLDEYISTMERDGEWAGNVELAALSSALGLNFVVHQAGQRPLVLAPSGASDGAGLHLSYHDGEHFNAVRAGSDAGSARSALALVLDADAGRYVAVSKTTVADLAMRAGSAAPSPAGRLILRQPAAARSAGGGDTALDDNIADSEGGGSEEGSTGAGCSAPAGAAGTAGADALTQPVQRCSGARPPAALATAPHPSAAPRRNGPCSCGSGKVYRRCCQEAHLAVERAAERRLAALSLSAAAPADAASAAQSSRRKRGARVVAANVPRSVAEAAAADLTLPIAI